MYYVTAEKPKVPLRKPTYQQEEPKWYNSQPRGAYQDEDAMSIKTTDSELLQRQFEQSFRMTD
jgi:hypothetical protein